MILSLHDLQLFWVSVVFVFAHHEWNREPCEGQTQVSVSVILKKSSAWTFGYFAKLALGLQSDHSFVLMIVMVAGNNQEVLRLLTELISHNHSFLRSGCSFCCQTWERGKETSYFLPHILENLCRKEPTLQTVIALLYFDLKVPPCGEWENARLHKDCFQKLCFLKRCRLDSVQFVVFEHSFSRIQMASFILFSCASPWIERFDTSMVLISHF